MIGRIGERRKTDRPGSGADGPARLSGTAPRSDGSQPTHHCPSSGGGRGPLNRTITGERRRAEAKTYRDRLGFQLG